jgi:hypothetical protein
MSRKRSFFLILFGILIAVVVLWQAAGWLWHMLLKMHGVH